MSTFRATAGYEQVVDATLIVRCCSECSIIYAVPVRLRERCVEKGGGWYCPSGHWQVPQGKTLEEKLEDERRRAGRLAAERDQMEASVRAQKAAASRARNERDRARRRHAAGVCPCCHRSFKQLRRHMASQHPDYRPEGEH